MCEDLEVYLMDHPFRIASVDEHQGVDVPASEKGRPVAEMLSMFSKAPLRQCH